MKRGVKWCTVPVWKNRPVDPSALLHFPPRRLFTDGRIAGMRDASRTSVLLRHAAHIVLQQGTSGWPWFWSDQDMYHSPPTTHTLSVAASLVFSIRQKQLQDLFSGSLFTSLYLINKHLSLGSSTGDFIMGSGVGKESN